MTIPTHRPRPEPPQPLLPTGVAIIAGLVLGALLMATIFVLPLVAQVALISLCIGLVVGFVIGSDRARRLIERVLEESP